MSYDPKCQELAEYFLGDKATPNLAQELAQVIQDAIEDFFAGREKPGVFVVKQ